MFENMNKDPMELVKELGLEKLDESSLDIVKKMLNYRDLKCLKFKEKAIVGSISDINVNATAIYNQNYIIMKQLLNLQEQNQQLIEQNQKSIELNQQIIDLLTDIKNK